MPLKGRKAYFTPYPRFTRSGKTRICLLMSRKAYFTPYPRFTRSGKTRICLLKSRKAYFTSYPRFTRSGKTRILLQIIYRISRVNLMKILQMLMSGLLLIGLLLIHQKLNLCLSGQGKE